jgi:hypothetical protein
LKSLKTIEFCTNIDTSNINTSTFAYLSKDQIIKDYSLNQVKDKTTFELMLKTQFRKRLHKLLTTKVSKLVVYDVECLTYPIVTEIYNMLDQEKFIYFFGFHSSLNIKNQSKIMNFLDKKNITYGEVN